MRTASVNNVEEREGSHTIGRAWARCRQRMCSTITTPAALHNVEHCTKHGLLSEAGHHWQTEGRQLFLGLEVLVLAFRIQPQPRQYALHITLRW